MSSPRRTIQCYQQQQLTNHYVHFIILYARDVNKKKGAIKKSVFNKQEIVSVLPTITNQTPLNVNNFDEHGVPTVGTPAKYG